MQFYLIQNRKLHFCMSFVSGLACIFMYLFILVCKSGLKTPLLIQVFDGHGGKHAADFACYHLPRFIVEDDDFPQEIERVITSAFLQTDTAFAEACTLDGDLASGTTALTALVIGRLVFYILSFFPFCQNYGCFLLSL